MRNDIKNEISKQRIVVLDWFNVTFKVMTSVVGGNSGEQLSSSYSPSFYANVTAEVHNKILYIYCACQYALIYVLLLLCILVYS